MARPRLAPPLFSQGAVESLLRAARQIPGDFSCILEVRLGADDGAVDLSLAIATPGQALRLAGLPLPPHVVSLLRSWPERQASLQALTALWLELDLRSESPGPPGPRTGRPLPVPVVCGRMAPGTAPETLADDLLPALHGRPLAAEGRRLLLGLCAALPDSARPLYLFSLGTRQPPAVRLEVFSRDADFVPGYLAIAAPELLPAALRTVPLLAAVERIHLSLDLPENGEALLPRLGLEGSFPRQPAHDRRWEMWFDRLVATGLCAPAARDAALAWPGVDSIWTAAERWPVGAAALALRCVRGLSHLKVSCGLDGRPEAKVYLTLGAFAPSGVAPAESSPASASVRST